MKVKAGCARRTAAVAFGQKGSGATPQVRWKTSGRTSIAMSQRTPSHLPAMAINSSICDFCSSRIGVVELQRVGPTGIIGVASMRQDARPPIGFDPHVVLRRAANLFLAALHIVVRVGLHPGMIGRGMVRHEIQHQLDIALRESFAKLRQRRVAPDLVADRVGGDSEAGAAYVVLFEVGQHGAELGSPFRPAPRDGPACGTGSPDAQQPNPVEALPSEAVDRGVVNFGQGDSFVTLTGQASQPDAGIELIEGGVAWRDRHGRSPVSYVAV